MAESRRTLTEISLDAWRAAVSTAPDSVQVVVIAVLPQNVSELGLRGDFVYQAPVSMDGTMLVGVLSRAEMEAHLLYRQAREEARMLAELDKAAAPSGEL